jgi:hypothetical protein
MPTAGETPRFGPHIKPLFRRRDRQSMSFAFDLWSHADVSQRAATILGSAAGRHYALRRRLADGEDRHLRPLDRRWQVGLVPGGRTPRITSSSKYRTAGADVAPVQEEP